jgi:predicted PurR-regulated permease PerM
VSKPSAGAGWQRAILTLTGTVVGVVVIGTLFWAQAVFIPVALAGFLTFLLSPLVNRFRQSGLPRAPSVIVVVLLAATALGGVGWLVTDQIGSLLNELPKYRQTVKQKVRTLKQVAGGSGHLQEMIKDINKELDGTATRGGQANDGGEAGRDSGEAMAQAPAAPTAVIVEPQRAAWLSRLSSFLSPMLEYLGELALAIILVIFMLLKREELRNRIIRLAGQGKIVAATKFVDEAGQRVSRFLLMQAIVNAGFGLIFGLGLLAIGVKYALLWGFLGAMLRYLPYIGPYLAVVFPISLSVAMSEGWGSTLEVIGLFLVLELIISNFIEPRLYGHSIGVSEVAMLVSAAFWAFLWGPIGLVLSSPLTVCLVVAGRYIPQLEFLSVLLGDEPALDAAISFYQRLLARDQDEAEGLVMEQMKAAESPEQIYDAMLLPALGAIKRNRVGGDITEEDERYALQAIREIIEDIGEGRIGATAGDRADGDGPKLEAPPAEPPIPIFACPAHDAEDRVALETLQHVLDPARWDVELIAPGTLTAELLDLLAERRPRAVCIASIPPGGLAHTRYLCKRLRARFPDLRILVGRWGAQDLATADPAREAGPDRGTSTLKEAAADSVAAAEETVSHPMIAGLKDAGADRVAATLLETRQQLASLIPVLIHGRDAEDRDGVAIGAVRPGPAAGREMAAAGRTS